MKDFTLVLEGEIDEEERDEKELSEQDDAVGERGGEGEGGEKQGKELLAFELRSIASSSSSVLAWVKFDQIGPTEDCSCLMHPGPDHMLLIRFDCR